MIFQTLGDLLWVLLFFPLFSLCSLRLFPGFLRLLVAGSKAKGGSGKEEPGTISGRQAAAATLAATIGTGNIIGTAQAIAMGGPGAVFWMWIAALLGFSVKCAEIWFGQQTGGAMATITAALGKSFGHFYALLSVLSTLLVGNMAQMNTVISSLTAVAPDRSCLPLVWSIILLLLIAISLFGGIRSLGRICSILVPVMALLFLACSFCIMFSDRENILPCLREILLDAWHPKAAFGASGGLALRSTLLWGFRRGAFSNEAGLGTAGTVHSLVRTADPDKHALWGILEIGVDTLLLCTVSALTLLCSKVQIPFGTLPGAELWFQVCSCSSKPAALTWILSLCLLFFGISTVLGCYVPGTLSAAWIGLDENRYRVLFLLCTVFGCFLPTELIWLSSDWINVLMAVPNLLSMVLLATQWEKDCEQSKNILENRDSSLARRERKV